DDTNLSNADLSGADLFKTNLWSANLSGADLSNADLSGADLFKTNLSEADLSGADLSGADLRKANLTHVRGLTIEQISVVKTLYGAKLNLERTKQVRKKYPHLLEESEKSVIKKVTLRSSYKTLSVSEVQSMPNVSIREKYDYGFYGYSKIIHHYHPESYLTEEVVEDNATGLMWCQSGFGFQVWRGATDWVEDLKSDGYAGYNDWRLPTLEEAVSLLESNWDDLYIDHVFSKEQWAIWTGDSRSHMEDVWSVDFDSGYVFCSLRCSCVRPVRSVLDNDSGGEPEEEVYEEVEVLEDEGHEEEDTIIEQYKQAIRINPDDAEAHFLLGVTYTNLKMYKKSIESFKQVIRIDPDCAGAHNNIGLAYGELGKSKEEIESYKQAIRIDHDLAVAHSSLGKAYIVLGKYEESIESSKQAIRINPDDASAHSNIGLAYGELGKNEESIELYKQAIRLDPDLAVSHFLLGNAYGRLDKWKEAIESYKQAISIDPDDANAHYSLGTAYFLLMDRDSAFEQYKILEKLDTEKANKLFNLFNR
ncbi:MAG: tetratricopeptide repeat protein, partial [Anaerolineales bacterium]|nr:tetratricopeptide repeat protein [Anaerolineales bacterium]